MQLFGDFDLLSFIRISRPNWIGRVNRMDSKRKVSQVFNNNPQGSRLRGRPKNGWWNCVKQRKIMYWKGRTKTVMTGRIPFRWRRSALDCSAFEEEEEKENT